jgi:hypothetical protein
MQAERRKLAERLDDHDGLRFSLLSGFEGVFDEFSSLKRSIWPNDRFYHPGFSQQRMRFAISIACAPKIGTAAPSMIRSILALDNENSHHSLDFRICNSLGKTIFHGLASKIATTAGSQNAADWHRLTCDILTHVTDIEDLTLDHHFAFILLFDGRARKTALMLLISESIVAEAQVTGNRGDKRLRPPSAVISGCEISIMAWLGGLHNSGIDLAEYGSNEQKSCRQAASIADYDMLLSVLSHPLGDFVIYEYFRLVSSLRLINFQYGKLPTDWKFWWNEPSDKFAGDFWRLVELDSTSVIMRVPGAWID